MLRSWVFVAALSLSVIVSFTSRRGDSETENASGGSIFSSSSITLDSSGSQGVLLNQTHTNAFLQYDFYRDKCPEAQNVVWSAMKEILSQQKNATAQLLRLLFHDCFIEGCDASVLLDDSNGNKNHSIERQAIPNRTLKGYNFIDTIKEELENLCPGVVSCADIIALATRDGIVLSGGPFYPVLTGRRDSNQSFYEMAMAGIPRPDGNITETLRAHNIGKIGCEFIQPRLGNFLGTGQPDPSIPVDFLEEMRIHCHDMGNSSAQNGGSSSMRTRGMREFTMSMTYFQGLSSSISSGVGFDTHYYLSLLRGRGLLFADQQLMANEMTAQVVMDYASDDGTIFRKDFARVMVKMSGLGVLTGSNGQVRLNCSMPVSSK
ncbi:unnamed protein product [Ilex paraguariensis]|uniref:Peroxidase n=1 Tax=Ilex paraguariensis TaxID=185542 RepID=A0ABC8U4W9_9AQUA